MSERISAIDVTKGVGIISVAIGHVSVGFMHPMAMAVNMPLFFFLSGYLFRTRADRGRFIVDKAISLLLPYVVFTTIIFAAQYFYLRGWQVDAALPFGHRLLRSVRPLILGGRALSGWCAVGWFVTVLFLTQQLANSLIGVVRTSLLWSIVALSLVLAYINSQWAPQFWLPLNANVVAMAWPLFYAGYLYRRHESHRLQLIAMLVSVIAIALLAAGIPISYDMRAAHYGIVGLSLVTALGMSVTVMTLCGWAARSRAFRAAAAALGAASLVIMFVHQPVQLIMRDVLHIDSSGIRLVTCLGVSYLLYLAMSRAVWSRALFLGSRSDLQSLLSGARFAGRSPAVQSVAVDHDPTFAKHKRTP